jgi:hypothetical protein
VAADWTWPVDPDICSLIFKESAQPECRTAVPVLKWRAGEKSPVAFVLATLLFVASHYAEQENRSIYQKHTFQRIQALDFLAHALAQRLAVYSAAFHVMNFIQKEGILLGGEGSRHFEGFASSGGM